jgi:hypothetical protein
MKELVLRLEKFFVRSDNPRFTTGMPVEMALFFTGILGVTALTRWFTDGANPAEDFSSPEIGGVSPIRRRFPLRPA